MSPTRNHRDVMEEVSDLSSTGHSKDLSGENRVSLTRNHRDVMEEVSDLSSAGHSKDLSGENRVSLIPETY